MFYKPSKFWDNFTLTHLIVLLSLRIVPEHSDKPVTKVSIRTRVYCFSFTVIWTLYQRSSRISKCTDLKNIIILYTILSKKRLLLDCSQSPTFPSDHPDQALCVLQVAILVSSVPSLAWGWGSNLLRGWGTETWCSPSQYIWNQDGHLKEPTVPVGAWSWWFYEKIGGRKQSTLL